MKDTKVKRIRQNIAMLKQQFLQDGTGVFDQVLGVREIAAVADELVEPYRERIYPRWTRCACSLGKSCLPTVPAKTWWAAAYPNASRKTNP